MVTKISPGNLIKLRGLNSPNIPIGIIMDLYQSYATVRWSNPDIAQKWAVPTTIELTKIEKVG